MGNMRSRSFMSFTGTQAAQRETTPSPPPQAVIIPAADAASPIVAVSLAGGGIGLRSRPWPSPTWRWCRPAASASRSTRRPAATCPGCWPAWRHRCCWWRAGAGVGGASLIAGAAGRDGLGRRRADPSGRRSPTRRSAAPGGGTPARARGHRGRRRGRCRAGRGPAGALGVRAGTGRLRRHRPERAARNGAPDRAPGQHPSSACARPAPTTVGQPPGGSQPAPATVTVPDPEPTVTTTPPTTSPPTSFTGDDTPAGE